jgi:hypothetical protein
MPIDKAIVERLAKAWLAESKRLRSAGLCDCGCGQQISAATRPAEARLEQERLKALSWPGAHDGVSDSARKCPPLLVVARQHGTVVVPWDARCITSAERSDEFTGRATVSGLLAGVLTTDGMVTPAGSLALRVVKVSGIVGAA